LRQIGLLNLLRKISQRLPDPTRRVSLEIPYREGRVLSQIYQQGRVLRRDDRGDAIVIEAEVPASAVARLRPYLKDGPPLGKN
jgi:50S ribosomal subunit-associated GTPase HflX